MDEATVKRLKKEVGELMAQDRQKLLIRYPFTGGVAMRLELVPVHDCRLETCSTDYERIYADVEFYAKLNEDERLHVFAHEVWHCILLHGLRQQRREHRRFNIAADLEIYFLLEKERLGIPAHLDYLMDWWQRNLNAEQIYEEMPRLHAAMRNNGEYVKGVAPEHLQMGREGAGFDKHEHERGSGPDDRGDSATAPTDSEIYFDDDYCPGWVRGAFEGMREKVLSAAQQMERMRGRLPGHLQAIVKALLKPEIRWQEVLAQFVTSVYGGSRRWLPPSRRHIGRGVYLQSARQTRLKAAVAVDTSGSTQEDLPKFFAELNSLLTSFGEYDLTVIQCDAAITSVERYDASRPFPAKMEWRAFGGGGTDFRPVFDYLAETAEPPSLLIFVTDGYGPAPERAPGYPVLWALTRDGVVPAPWGAVVQFKE